MGGRGRAKLAIAAVHQVAEVGAAHLAVEEAQLVRQHLVEDDAPDGGDDPAVDQRAGRLVPGPHADLDRLVQSQGHGVVVDRRPWVVVRQRARGATAPAGHPAARELERQEGRLFVRERARGGQVPLAVALGHIRREVVAAQDHVLGRRDDRAAIGGRQQVRRREQHRPRLFLGGRGERHVDRHLVAVEVGIERRADERVNLDRRALHEDRHERLDAQPVQGGRAVEQDRVILDDLFENVPDRGVHALDDSLRALDVMGEALLHQLAHDERLEQLEGHLLGQAALVQLELRSDHDHGAARIVDALAEQVLAEPALLALEHVAQALEPVVPRPGDGSPAAAIVDQGVARFLQHPLLVADDDLGGTELQEPLEPVVPVDHAPVQVVEVGGREATAVELDHRTQLRWEHGEHRQDHPLRPRSRPAERLDQAQPLDRLLAPLAGRGPDLDVQGATELLELHPGDDVAHGLGTHAGPEDPAAARPGARAVLLVEIAEVRLGERHERLEALDLVALAADLVLATLGSPLPLFAVRVDRGAHLDLEVRDLLLRGALLGLLAGPELLGDSLRLSGRDLAQARPGLLGALVARAEHHFAGGSEGDRLLGRAGLEVGQPSLDLLGGTADLVGPA